MVKFLPEFGFFFTIILKNRNFISKIRRSKVTDYAALTINSATKVARELNGTSLMSLATHNAKGEMREI